MRKLVRMAVATGSALLLLIQFPNAASAETLKFQSYEPGDHQGIFSGNWRTNPFSAKAKFWPAAQPDSPLVVYSPGWGGSDKYFPAFKDIRKRLGDGYHHIFLTFPDSVDLAGRTVTIYEAIRAAQGRGLDPSKIFLIGASGGGQEAIHATHSKTAAALGVGISINGVVAFYPSCRVQFEDRGFNKTPTLIFIGGKDEVAPGKLCKDFKENGGLGHAQLNEFPAAGHSWLMTKRAGKSSERTWGDCRIEIDRTGVWRGEGFDSKQGIGDMLKGMSKKCAKKVKMLVGRDDTVYSNSVQSAIEFMAGL